MTNVNTLGFSQNQSQQVRAASASWAAANVRVGASLGLRALRSSHTGWWHDFYAASFLTLRCALLLSLRTARVRTQLSSFFFLFSKKRGAAEQCHIRPTAS